MDITITNIRTCVKRYMHSHTHTRPHICIYTEQQKCVAEKGDVDNKQKARKKGIKRMAGDAGGQTHEDEKTEKRNKEAT